MENEVNIGDLIAWKSPHWEGKIPIEPFYDIGIVVRIEGTKVWTFFLKSQTEYWVEKKKFWKHNELLSRAQEKKDDKEERDRERRSHSINIWQV